MVREVHCYAWFRVGTEAKPWTANPSANPSLSHTSQSVCSSLHPFADCFSHCSAQPLNSVAGEIFSGLLFHVSNLVGAPRDSLATGPLAGTLKYKAFGKIWLHLLRAQKSPRKVKPGNCATVGRKGSCCRTCREAGAPQKEHSHLLRYSLSDLHLNTCERPHLHISLKMRHTHDCTVLGAV